MRNKTIPLRTNQRGFTLAEIAIVTMILGLLVVGVLGSLSNQVTQGRITRTERQLEEIREALLGFAARTGYLPCPDTDGDGIEDAPNRAVATPLACASVEGFLPWVTLGVSQTDAWGIRFRYRIKDEFARASAANSPAVGGLTPIAGCVATAGTTDPASTADPNNCTLDIQDTGDIQINTRGGATGKTLITQAGGDRVSGIGVPVVIMSFGPNGFGGVDAFGNVRPLPPVSNVDENTNVTTPKPAFAPVFVARTSKGIDAGCSETAATGALCEFDDIVTWIPTPLLVSKLLQANRLP